MIKQKIEKLITEALSKTDIQFSQEDVLVEQTDSLNKGDYTTNIAMKLASKLGVEPREVARKIVENIEEVEEIEKIEIAGPGFINFYLSTKYLNSQIGQILEKGADEYIKTEIKKDKNILIEYTDANPFKVLHIGHLYTNTVGEAFSRLQEAIGANVKRANYQGDIGLHVAKTMWGIKHLLDENNQTFEEIEELELTKRVEFLGEAYMTGAQYYDDIEDKDAIEQIQDLNYYLFQMTIPSLPQKEFKEFDDMGIDKWYEKGRKWCLEQFEEIYEVLGTNFDYQFFESEVGEVGYNMVKENIGKIFKEDKGAVIYEGDPDKGLHTRVFINQFGLPTYEAKEIGLAKLKSEKDNWDESLMITDKSQAPYFKVVFDTLSNLLPDYANIVEHIPHGIVALPGMKKMSSRKGEVVAALDLLDTTQKAVKNLMQESDKVKSVEDIDEISLKIAIAAIKYAFLRVGVGKNITFDLKKDIEFDGDTGPYLMYVYTRAQSILDSAKNKPDDFIKYENASSNPHVIGLIRNISKARSVVLGSAVNYSPSTLCTYLFELGQAFNQFYQEVPVLKSKKEDRKYLLAIVKATAETMKMGLNLLGIETVSRM
jgi:arginyl-tRNA synthetase